MPHERTGLVPDQPWKEKRFRQPWQGGETINLSIGQGFLQVSPLQVARFLAALLNGGKLLKPVLDKNELPTVLGELPMNPSIRATLQKDMIATVEQTRGTAGILRTDGIVIGGKTGTAQVVKLMEQFEEKKTEEIPYKYRDHACKNDFEDHRKERRQVGCVCQGNRKGPVSSGYLHGRDALWKDPEVLQASRPD